jgi:putative DNA primase/helicase
MLDFNEGSTWVWGEPYVPPPPIVGMMTDTGMGKTQLWRQKVAAPLVAEKRHPVLTVPLHRLGEETVEDFAAQGIEAFCFRGRDAPDPLAPGHKMCREQERIGAISSALADVSRHACKRGDKVCPQFEVCGYQRQQRERPQVSVCAHEMLFRQRPGFIRAPDALGIDERFWDAGLRGADTLKPEKLPLCLLKGDRHIRRDVAGTADLVATSDRVYAVLLGESAGFLRRDAFLEAGVTIDELRAALKLEWKRLKKIDDVYPGMPVEKVQLICMRVAIHNQDVRRLAVF